MPPSALQKVENVSDFISVLIYQWRESRGFFITRGKINIFSMNQTLIATIWKMPFL